MHLFFNIAFKPFQTAFLYRYKVYAIGTAEYVHTLISVIQIQDCTVSNAIFAPLQVFVLYIASYIHVISNFYIKFYTLSCMQFYYNI